jgi:hypothetical protein
MTDILECICGSSSLIISREFIEINDSHSLPMMKPKYNYRCKNCGRVNAIHWVDE